MKNLLTIQQLLVSMFSMLLHLLKIEQQQDDAERGDVPGWVMITMMSALLVAALLVVAQDALINMFNNAMSMIG